MDGREQLRRYLEQRREAGEQDLVLDQLTVAELMRLLGAPRASATLPPMSTHRTVPAPAASDWREILRHSGAAPGREPGREPEREREQERAVPVTSEPPMQPAPQASATPAPTPAPIPTLDLPSGIIVEAPVRELFGGSAVAALDSLDAVATAVASCTKCPLYASAKNPVPGSGSPRAPLMVVGEAPGQTEDEQGLPFVGAAGNLLTKILEAIDFRREDVYICNVLKHRPPGNRNPLPDEVTACSPYLVRQFEIIKPRIILALGTFAAQTLLETKLAIGKLRGQLHRYHGVPLIVTYHPAALLRNPAWKRPTWEDVQLVRRILDSAVGQS